MRPPLRKPRTKKDGGRYSGKPRVCQFCADKVEVIDYKDSVKLGRYITDSGRIVTRRQSSACSKHQRGLTIAIKRARHIALLPYTPAHVQKSGGVGIVRESRRSAFPRPPIQVEEPAAS